VTRSRVLAALLLLAALTALTACGVPTHGSASKVRSKDVPFGLLRTENGSSASGDSGHEEALIYFAKNGRLVASSRRLEPPVTVQSVVRALGRGPNQVEIAAGVRSALPDKNPVSRVSLSSGTARVDLARPFTALSSSDQIVALGQLVYTLTGRPGVGLVRFTLLGRSTEVPRADGSLTAARVSRDDYLAIAPSPTP
jgi:spore germination protein GerM